MNKKVSRSVGTMAISLFLVACGPSLEDAKRLGFESVGEMKEMQAKGYKNKDEFKQATAQSLGFKDVAEMEMIRAQGFFTKSAFVEKQRAEQEQKLALSASKLGFKDHDEMLKLQAEGYATKADWQAAQQAKLEEKQRLANEEAAAEVRKLVEAGTGLNCVGNNGSKASLYIQSDMNGKAYTGAKEGSNFEKLVYSLKQKSKDSETYEFSATQTHGPLEQRSLWGEPELAINRHNLALRMTWNPKASACPVNICSDIIVFRYQCSKSDPLQIFEEFNEIVGKFENNEKNKQELKREREREAKF